jgi:hypothetical protein
MFEEPALSGLRRRLTRHRSAAHHIPGTPVRDPRGGRSTVDELLDRRAEVHARIDAEERDGSRRHHRISLGRRWLLRLLPVLDGLVLCWFLVGVLNADLRNPDPTVAVAAVLAVLGSIAVAAWNATVGEHLRRWKDEDGNLEWGAVDGVGRGLLGAGAVMWALLGAMMYVRVSDEVYQATGVDGAAVVVVALALSAAVVLVNAYVLVLAFADGSPLTGELDRIGRAAGPAVRRRHRY